MTRTIFKKHQNTIGRGIKYCHHIAIILYITETHTEYEVNECDQTFTSPLMLKQHSKGSFQNVLYHST